MDLSCGSSSGSPSSETLGFGRVWLGGKPLESSYVDLVDHCVGVDVALALEGSGQAGNRWIYLMEILWKSQE